ncbi:haloacid dehalogenase [Streptococcus pseudopneumoniae G42]|nr:haloacid dehalogenase [Streptococcus pseudopneumoniae G42]
MIYLLFLKCGIIIVSQKGDWDRMEVKAVFFDIDGTLVNNRKSVLKSTRDAIKIVKEQGVLVGVATGRGPFLLRN